MLHVYVFQIIGEVAFKERSIPNLAPATENVQRIQNV